MMFNTIPLVSLFRRKNECLSCGKHNGEVKGYLHNITKHMEIIYDDVILERVGNDDNHTYDYKCSSCITDREYNMSTKYNRTHTIKESYYD